ncbi:hypothetical protein ACRAWF_01230 [Streptomyces sp. L7]
MRFLDGELWLGMMPDSLKALDLRRDARFALQANPGPGTDTHGGDVRVSGRAVEVTDAGVKGRTKRWNCRAVPPLPHQAEVVRTYVEDETYLVVQVWKPGGSVRTSSGPEPPRAPPTRWSPGASR